MSSFLFGVAVLVTLEGDRDAELLEGDFAPLRLNGDAVDGIFIHGGNAYRVTVPKWADEIELPSLDMRGRVMRADGKRGVMFPLAGADDRGIAPGLFFGEDGTVCRKAYLLGKFAFPGLGFKFPALKMNLAKPFVRAGRALEKGVSRAGRTVERGVQRAGRTLERGVQQAGKAVERIHTEPLKAAAKFAENTARQVLPFAQQVLSNIPAFSQQRAQPEEYPEEEQQFSEEQFADEQGQEFVPDETEAYDMSEADPGVDEEVYE